MNSIFSSGLVTQLGSIQLCTHVLFSSGYWSLTPSSHISSSTSHLSIYSTFKELCLLLFSSTCSHAFFFFSFSNCFYQLGSLNFFLAFSSPFSVYFCLTLVWLTFITHPSLSQTCFSSYQFFFSTLLTPQFLFNFTPCIIFYIYFSYSSYFWPTLFTHSQLTFFFSQVFCIRLTLFPQFCFSIFHTS